MRVRAASLGMGIVGVLLVVFAVMVVVQTSGPPLSPGGAEEISLAADTTGPTTPVSVTQAEPALPAIVDQPMVGARRAPLGCRIRNGKKSCRQ